MIEQFLTRSTTGGAQEGPIALRSPTGTADRAGGELFRIPELPPGAVVAGSGPIGEEAAIPFRHRGPDGNPLPVGPLSEVLSTAGIDSVALEWQAPAISPADPIATGSGPKLAVDGLAPGVTEGLGDGLGVDLSELMPDLDLAFPAEPLDPSQLRESEARHLLPDLATRSLPSIADAGRPTVATSMANPIAVTIPVDVAALPDATRALTGTGADAPELAPMAEAAGRQADLALRPGMSGFFGGRDAARGGPLPPATAEALSVPAAPTAPDRSGASTPVASPAPGTTPSPVLSGPLAAPGSVPPGPAPAGMETLATLRQALADLTRDSGGERRSAVAEPVVRGDSGPFMSSLSLAGSLLAGGAERPSFVLPAPPGAPEFADQISERVIWMAGQKLDRAQIRLNPAHLGPISVDVSMGEDGASVTFTAQHPVTREALEQALPRLRELFSGSGVALAGADVAGQDSASRHADGGTAGSRSEATVVPVPDSEGAGEAGTAVAETPLRRDGGSRRLVDTYV